MAKKKAEEVKEEVVEEVVETTEPVVEEVEEVKEEATVEAEEVVEEATENIEEAEEEIKNTLVANTSFNDKYTGATYLEKTEFVVVDEDIETTKIKENQYKISAKRAEDFKAKGFVD
jgi:hypothetical protein